MIFFPLRIPVSSIVHLPNPKVAVMLHHFFASPGKSEPVLSIYRYHTGAALERPAERLPKLYVSFAQTNIYLPIYYTHISFTTFT